MNAIDVLTRARDSLIALGNLEAADLCNAILTREREAVGNTVPSELGLASKAEPEATACAPVKGSLDNELTPWLYREPSPTSQLPVESPPNTVPKSTGWFARFRCWVTGHKGVHLERQPGPVYHLVGKCKVCGMVIKL